jgi:transposase-like protein
MTAVKCPQCEGIKISKNGINANGKQRYICNNKECETRSFILEYTYKGCEPGVNEKIINMTANASGIRDIARVLKISKQKVQDTLKKRKSS